MIGGIVFDCDGTLVDSETISLSVLVNYLRENNFSLMLEEAIDRFAGTNLSFVFQELSAFLPNRSPEQHATEFRRRQIESLQRDLQPVNGATELLASVTVPYCLASNAPRNKIDVCLKTTGLDRYFTDDRIHSAYDHQRWKPDPHLLLHAADALGIDTMHCLLVEDSLPGVQAGIAAGMRVVLFDPHRRVRNQIQGVAVIDRLVDVHQFVGS